METGSAPFSSRADALQRRYVNIPLHSRIRNPFALLIQSSTLVPINNEQVSLGGWTDPTPAQVLTSMGCDKIVLINRPDGIGQFSVDIPVLLGASDEELRRLYELSDPRSSFTTALATADATICANWDEPDSSDVEALAQTGYDGPLLSSDDCILSLGVGASNDQVVGCTPGAV